MKDFREVIGDDDQALALFMRNMRKFDAKFCDAMTGKQAFNIRLEVKGDKGRISHCRVSDDVTERMGPEA